MTAMTDQQKRDLKRRCALCLHAGVPKSVAQGTAIQAHLFKQDIAVLAAYVRTGHGADKVRLAVSRVEGLHGQGVAVLACDAPDAAGRAGHTPTSNTGVNEVSGSGRGLARGYGAAIARVLSNAAAGRGAP